MTESLKFDYCDITLYDQYLVNVVKEAIDITPAHNTLLIDIADRYYPDKPFVYISNRIHSYSVNPSIYTEMYKIGSLKGIAVVSSNHKTQANAKIEKMFFNKPFEIFTTLEEAKLWTAQLLDKA